MYLHCLVKCKIVANYTDNIIKNFVILSLTCMYVLLYQHVVYSPHASSKLYRPLIVCTVNKTVPCCTKCPT